jgi:hypothetical protein
MSQGQFLLDNTPSSCVTGQSTPTYQQFVPTFGGQPPVRPTPDSWSSAESVVAGGGDHLQAACIMSSQSPSCAVVPRSGMPLSRRLRSAGNPVSQVAGTGPTMAGMFSSCSVLSFWKAMVPDTFPHAAGRDVPAGAVMLTRDSVSR